MKKIFTLFITATLISSSISLTSFAENSYTTTSSQKSIFNDLDNVPWEGVADVIENIASLGLVNGYEDGSFRANNNVTYSEVLQMIYTTMVRSGSAQLMQSIGTSSYTDYFERLQIPTWAYSAIAFALDNKIVYLSDLSKFVTDGNDNPATREDVAVYFSRAFSDFHYNTGSTSQAEKFYDSQLIQEENLNAIDTSVRLGLIIGDHKGYFKPQDLINRAEMSVILDRSYTLLKEGFSDEGVITSISQIGEIYIIEITFDDGTVDSFSANSTSAEITAGSNNTPITLSKLIVGDAVEIVTENDFLKKLHVPNLSTTVNSTYDVTGYIDKFSTDSMTIENINSESTEVYTLSNNVTVYIDGERSNLANLDDEFSSSRDNAHVGIMISSEFQSQTDSSGNRYLEQDIDVLEIHVTFTEDYTKRGTVTDLYSDVLKISSLTNNSSTQYKLTDDVVYYIDDKETTYSKFEDLVDSGNVYLTITIGYNNVVTKIEASNLPFSTSTELSDKVYTLKNISTYKMQLTSSSENYIHNFTSTTGGDIDFYCWEEQKDGSYAWNSSSLAGAITYKDAIWDNDSSAKISVKVVYNDAAKISRIELSDVSSAWTYDTSLGNSENRKAIVSSSSDGILKFQNVSSEYKLLTSYNVLYSGNLIGNYIVGEDPNDSSKEVRNPLSVMPAQTSSLTVFNRLANSDSVVMYAEAIIDTSNNVQKIDAKLVEATGYLRYCDLDEEKLTLELEDTGETVYLVLDSRPKVCDNIGDYTNLETTIALGGKIFIEFNDYGEIDYIELLRDTSYVTGARFDAFVSGITDGFEVISTGDQFTWGSRNSTILYNYSTTASSTYGVDKLLHDPSVDVYVSCRVGDNNTIDELKVYVDYAYGVFKSYDRGSNHLQITTHSGETFTFYTQPSADINIFDIPYSSINSEAVGYEIELTFEDGLVTMARPL